MAIIIWKPVQVNVTYYLVLKNPEVVSIDGIQITSSTAETLLGINIDLDLNFENHLSTICTKVSREINALERIANCLFLEKRRILMKTFIESQYNYCPLTWMFHWRTINSKINRLHKRAFGLSTLTSNKILRVFLWKTTPFQYI